MANNPNDNEHDPKPTPNPSDIPPPAPKGKGEDEKLDELPDIDLSEVEFDDLPDPVGDGTPSSTGGSAISFDPPPLADLASGTSGLSGAIPEATPASGELPAPEGTPESGIGNLEPVAPVAPASGWLDSDHGETNLDPGEVSEPLGVHPADLFEAPPPIESSDIFAGGPLPQASPVEHSDVIAATSSADAELVDPTKPGRPSDVALSFAQPPGGSTLQDGGASGDLPVADVLVEAEEVPNDSGRLFDEAKLGTTPLIPGVKPIKPPEVADFGASPELTPDASSILADLAGPADHTHQDSSAVKIESPGVGRTLSSRPEEGTEFDLTVDDAAVPPELTEAAAAAESDQTDWGAPADSDLFSHARTAPDMTLDDESGRVDPLESTPLTEDPSFTSAQSSIFSDKGVPTDGGRSDGSEVSLDATLPAGKEDSSVEFSPNPEAEDEASESRILRGPTTPAPPPASPVRKPTPRPTSSADFELPDETAPVADADADMVNWEAADEAEAAIGGARETLDKSDSPPSGILKRGRKPSPAEDEDPDATKSSPRPLAASRGKPAPAKPDKKSEKTGKGDRVGEDASVEIDWLAGSSTEQPPLKEDGTAGDEVDPDEVDLDAPTRESSKIKKAREAAAREAAAKKAKPEKKTKPERESEPAGSRRGGMGWIGGALAGMLVAGGGFAGMYFGGLIPNSEKTAQGPPPPPGMRGPGMQGPPGMPAPPGMQGQPGMPAQLTPADVAAAIRAGDPARAKKIAEELKDATPIGKALVGEAGLFALVQDQKADAPIAADNPELKAARENLQALVDDADAAKTAEGEKAAVKATIQLGISHELTGDRAGAKKVYEDAKAKFPKHTATFDAALDRVTATTPAAPAKGDGDSRRLTPADAQQLLFAVTLLQAETPAKDKEKEDEPEAGVFFWKAMNKAAGGKYADAVDEIKKAKAAHVKQAKAMAGQGLNPLSDPLEQIFPRCCDDLKAYWELRGAIYANKAVADLINKDGAEKAIAELASAQKKAAESVKLMTDLKDATDKLTVAAKDLKDAKDLATKFEKDVKTTDDAKLAVEKKLDAEEKAHKDADTARQKADDFITSLAKELQTAKLLPAKFDSAEFLAAQKKAAERASGPTLTSLVPSAMMAIGGGGLSSAQLIDIAERLVKAEATAKAAADKLTTETAKLNAAHEAATTKLKDDQAAELKKMADKYVADAKKIGEGFEGKIKELEAIVAREKDRADTQVAQFKRDLGNAIGPAQALDLWLPLLVELRRPVDADPALATATKVIGSAAPNSDDWAKARTVAGLSLLYKGELEAAKMQLQAAKMSPAYEPAVKAKKLWASAADVGLASVSDPLAPFRQPPELPKRDPMAAARFLDTGVKAYKDGRNSDAVTALTDSTKADPTDPLAWYFLGAARWGMGSTDAAKDDFRQGSVREAASPVPTRLISGAISPIQGPARDALTAARP